MRFQTSFEKIAAVTNVHVAGLALVLLRLAVGLTMFVGGLNMPGPWSLSLMFGGAMLILGLLVRPVAVVSMIASLLIILPTLIDSVTAEFVMTSLQVFGVNLLLASGGLGHAYGLDGVILRNIHRPGKVAKFLFG